MNTLSLTPPVQQLNSVTNVTQQNKKFAPTP